MHIDPAGAHCLLGGLAALHYDVDKAREHHRIALQYPAQTAMVSYNYSIALLQLGEVMEAFEHAGRAVDIASDDSQYLENFICMALETAHFRHAHELCQQWNRTFPESPLPLASIARDLNRSVAAGLFSEEATREVLLTAQRILAQAKAKMANRPIFQYGADPDSFFCQVPLFRPVNAALDLYDQLLDHIVESDRLSNDPGTRFLVSFIGTRPNVG